MLFDLEDFSSIGWIGYGAGKRFQNDERTIANSDGIENYSATLGAVRDAHIKAVNQRALNSIRLLSIDKRPLAVQKYFAWMDAVRDFHLYNTAYPNNGTYKFTSMIGSLRVLPVIGGVTFNEGDQYKYINIYDLSEEEAATLPNIRVLSSETPGQTKAMLEENGLMTYVPFDQEWLDVYFTKFEAIVDAEYELINASEGLTENFTPYVAPIVVPVTKFKHEVSVGQTFNGTIKTTTGFVKFAIGKEEFLLGSTGSTGVNFTIPVGATSKKSGNFFSCDSTGSFSGDVLEIIISSPISSIDLKNAPELTKFVATNGTFGSLSLTKNTKLTYLDVRSVETLTSLNLSGLNLLEEVYCQGCSIGTLNLTGATNLVRIEAANNKLSGVNLNGLSSLTYADFGNNSFMPSSRGLLLIDLDLAGSTGGTLISPLEGRKSDSDAAYTSLISKGWTLTSDGIALSKGIYGSSIIGEPFSGWVLTTTGYYKISSDKGVLIKGGSQFAIDENSNYYAMMDDANPGSPLGNFLQDYDLQEFSIPGGCPNGYSIHPCDVDGNIIGDICGLGIVHNDKFEALDLDLSKIAVVQLTNCKVENNEAFLNQIPVPFDLDMTGALSSTDYVFDVSVMDLRRFRTGYSNNNLSIKGLDSLNLLSLDFTSAGLKSTTGVTGTYDLSNMTNLRSCYLDFSWVDDSITGLNFSGLSNITWVNIFGTHGFDNIQSIDISDCTSIDQSNIQGFEPTNGGIVSLNLSNTISMTSLHIRRVRLHSDPISYYEFTPSSILTNLSIFDVGKLKINTGASISELWVGGSCTHIIIEDQPSINRFGIENCYNLQELNIVSPLTNLRYFNGISLSRDSQNGINLDMSKIPNIIEFSATERSKINQITNLSSATQLLRFYIGQSVESSNPISLDFSSCTNLDTLSLSGCNFSGTLNVSNTNLSGTLYLYGTRFTGTLNVSNTKIANLYLGESKFTSVDITNAGNGNYSFALWGQNARELTSIIGANNNPKIWRIDLTGSKVTSLDVSGSTNLNTIYCPLNPLLTTVNVSGCTNIEFLTVNYNSALTSIITSSSTRIRQFNSNYCTSLTSLDFSNISNIFEVQCYFCDNLTSITGLANKTQLEKVYVYRTKITNIDLSGCTNIRYVYVHLTLFSPSATDSFLSTIAPIIRNYGQVIVRENRTSASNSAIQTLLNKGTYVAYAG